MYQYKGFEIQIRCIDGEIFFALYRGEEYLGKASSLMACVRYVDDYFEKFYGKV